MKRAVLVAVSFAWLLHAVVPAQTTAPAPPDALKFFKNYFVTGDYVVGGVQLAGAGQGGVATGTIDIAGVPDGADVLAAFLYWQVVTTDTLGPASGSTGATFDGQPLTSPDGPVAKVLGDYGTAPCWSSGGGTGTSGGTKRTYAFRADVLRFLRPDTNETSETYGKFIANGAHTVQIPDSGSTGNAPPIALGASLVIVYRDTPPLPNEPAQPLSAVVLYDGSFTVDNSTPTLAQTIEGFYQAAASPNAKITYIAGSGQQNKREDLYFGAGSSVPQSFASDAFDSVWENLTYSGSGFSAGTANRVTTVVDTTNLKGSDCLTWGAIVYKTDVRDDDGDGLVDAWESATAASPVVDPNGRALPPLGDMGASPNHRDLFVEIGYMYMPGDAAGNGVASYGGQTKPAHTHLPAPEALKLMGDAFMAQGIAVHFDIGDVSSREDLAPYRPMAGSDLGDYVVPAPWARGGESLDERVTQCEPADTGLPGPYPPWLCQYSAYPGTVGWKTGFRYFRDGLIALNPPAPPLPGEDDVCDLPGAPDGPGQKCERRFDRNRKDIFHYALFAHAVGLPKSPMPCLDDDGHPTLVDEATGQCAEDDTPNPDFRIPRTNSGVGDFPGGDVLITLGGFKDIAGKPTGTPFMQASTLMHELGHNFERRHSGEASTYANPNPNCKPTYLSVMNYLYQLRGLLDDQGTPHLDYSGRVDPTLNEQGLTDGFPAGSQYRLGWYAPLVEGSYFYGRPGVVPARSHCDGSPITDGAEMVRIDARSTGTPIDWNADGDTSDFSTLDINFNGRTTRRADGTGGGEILPGSDDWSNIRLNQIGGRRSVGGFYTDAGGVVRMGALSLDMGRFDMGRFDMGRFDMGRFDMGRFDMGRFDMGRFDMGQGDLGMGDLGRFDMGRFDMGRFDMGRFDMGRFDMGRFDMGAGDLGRGDYGGGGDLFQGDPNNRGGELDAETAGDLARTPPNTFTACVIGVDCPAGSPASPQHAVSLGWKAPNVGGVTSYLVYRVAGDTLLPGQTWIPASGPVKEVGPGTYASIDAGQLDYGKKYTYFVVAAYEDGIQSDPSNLVTITAPKASSAVVVTCPSSVTYTGLALTPCTARYTTAEGLSGSLGVTYTNNVHAGTAGASATYAGDATHYGSTGTASFTIARAAPAFSNLSGPTIDRGQTPTTLGGTLKAGTLVPSGSVEITLNGVTRSAAIDGSGAFSSSFATDALTVAGSPYTITYSYEGGANFSAAGPDTSMRLTVKSVYTFVNVENAPPPGGKSFTAGSAIPMRWQFTDGSAIVNSGSLHHTVTVRGPLPNGPIRTVSDTDPGSSSFRYDPTTRTWQFNLQTKDPSGQNFPVGTYEVTITPSGDPAFKPSPTFQIKLK